MAGVNPHGEVEGLEKRVKEMEGLVAQLNNMLNKKEIVVRGLNQQYEPETLLDFVEGQLKKRGIKGKVLFAMLAGSRCFNLNLPTSDDDFLAVYEAEAVDILKNTYTTTIDVHQPADCVIHELSKYLSLLDKGNPKVIEPLFSERYTYQSERWVDLKVSLRSSVINKNTLQQYISYAISKFFDSETESNKNYYHCIRLLSEANQIAFGKPPNVWFEGQLREFLMNIRTGKHNKDELVPYIENLTKHVKEIAQNSAIPNDIDKRVFEKWNYVVRTENLFKNAQIKATPILQTPFSSTELHNRAIKLLETNGIGRCQLICCFPSGSDLTKISAKSGSSGISDWIGIYAAPLDQCFQIFSSHRGVIVENEGIKSTIQMDARGMLLIELSVAVDAISNGHHRLWEILFANADQMKGLSIYETNYWVELKNVMK